MSASEIASEIIWGKDHGFMEDVTFGTYTENVYSSTQVSLIILSIS
jgi:hypothetical protein